MVRLIDIVISSVVFFVEPNSTDQQIYGHTLEIFKKFGSSTLEAKNPDLFHASCNKFLCATEGFTGFKSG